MELKLYIGEKIKYFRKNSGMTQDMLAEKLGTTKQTISRYEKGLRSADQDALFELSEIFNVSINEFFPQTIDTDKSIVAIYNQLERPRRQNVLDFATEQLEAQLNIVHEELYEYNVIHRLSAGTGSDIPMDYLDYDVVYHDKKIDYDLASYITGDSMEPTYYDGEIALIKKTGFDYDGGVYAVVWDGQTYIKKVYREDDGLRLVSLNKKYRDKFAPFEEEPVVIGLVVGHFVPEK